MEAKKLNAKSALNLEHSLLPVRPSQFQMLPQLMGPMKFASSPKATMKPAKSRKSMGQWMKLEAKGKRKSSEKRIPMAAMTGEVLVFDLGLNEEYIGVGCLPSV